MFSTSIEIDISVRTLFQESRKRWQWLACMEMEKSQQIYCKTVLRESLLKDLLMWSMRGKRELRSIPGFWTELWSRWSCHHLGWGKLEEKDLPFQSLY